MTIRNLILALSAISLFSCSSEDTLTPNRPDYPVTMDTQRTLDLARTGYECYDMETSAGKITIALDTVFAAGHAENFKRYVDENYYDGMIFHNVISSSLVQGGVLNPDLEPKTTHDAIPSEARNGLLNFRGRIAATRNKNEPDSATSGFLFNVDDNMSFNYGLTSDRYGLTVFGGVVAGMDVVDAISDVEVQTVDGVGYKPVEDVIINQVVATNCPTTAEPIEDKVINLPYPVNENDDTAEIDLARGDYRCFNMVTSSGNIELAIDTLYAPATAENFIQYVEDEFYTGLIFHRVVPDFMIQGGGLDADLNQKTTRAAVASESMNGLKNYRSRIAMARQSAPNSATSQFFINVVDNDFLNQDKAQDGVGYTVFGGVIAGMDVVDNIVDVPRSTQNGYQNVPNDDITIDSVTEFNCPIQ